MLKLIDIKNVSRIFVITFYISYALINHYEELCMVNGVAMIALKVKNIH